MNYNNPGDVLGAILAYVVIGILYAVLYARRRNIEAWRRGRVAAAAGAVPPAGRHAGQQRDGNGQATAACQPRSGGVEALCFIDKAGRPMLHRRPRPDLVGSERPQNLSLDQVNDQRNQHHYGKGDWDPPLHRLKPSGRVGHDRTLTRA
jgi:hypothetical protein